MSTSARVTSRNVHVSWSLDNEMWRLTPLQKSQLGWDKRIWLQIYIRCYFPKRQSHEHKGRQNLRLSDLCFAFSWIHEDVVSTKLERPCWLTELKTKEFHDPLHDYGPENQTDFQIAAPSSVLFMKSLPAPSLSRTDAHGLIYLQPQLDKDRLYDPLKNKFL